jgi:hypothetical protein
MRNVLKATGHGLKHFFGARESRDDYKALGRSFKRTNSKVRKAEVLATMGMYAVYKGSPIGLAKNIYDSIKVGTWKYGDIKKHQGNVDEVLAQTNMSDEGKRAIAKLMQSGGSGDEEANLSVADAAEFKRLENELHIAAGNCINF